MKTKPPAQRTSPQPIRRGREKKALRQEQILDAAFEAFAAHGYEAARIDDVARHAGIAKGTIYLYFRHKKQLFRAVVQSLPQRRLTATAKDFKGTGKQLVRALLSGMYSELVKNEKLDSIARMMISEGHRFPELVEIYHREIIAPGMKAIRQVLRRGIAAGEFRQTAALEFPQLLAAPAILALMWRVLHGSRHRLDLDAYSKAHIELVLDYLRSKVN